MARKREMAKRNPYAEEIEKLTLKIQKKFDAAAEHIKKLPVESAAIPESQATVVDATEKAKDVILGAVVQGADSGEEFIQRNSLKTFVRSWRPNA
jgi:methyl-accepting chemotaxis protein